MDGTARKRLVIFLNIAGLTVLGGIFCRWLKNSNYRPLYRAAALASVVFAAAIYCKFVPRWVDFRQGGDLSFAREETPPYTYIKIFFGLTAACFAMLRLIFIFRCIKGYSSTFGRAMGAWLETDANHYLYIAENGYLKYGDWNKVVLLVFPPGYPFVIKAVTCITGSYSVSAFVVSIVSFGLAGCVFYKLMRLDYNHCTAIRAVKFLAVYPGAYFFAGPMSESLFLLCMLGCIYLIRTKKWIAGGLAGTYCTLTRNTGLALLVVLIAEYIKDYYSYPNRKQPLRETADKILSLFMTAGGFGTYLLINYFVSGDPFKFMYYQKVHWSQSFGWFFNTVAYQMYYLTEELKTGSVLAYGLWLPNLIAVFMALIIILTAAKRLRRSYTALFICYFFVAIGASWLLSGPRYLAGLFVLPTALAVITDNKKTDIAATALCLILNVAYIYVFALRWGVW